MMNKITLKGTLFFLFISLVLYTIFFHELWADESHRLNIARNSISFSDFYAHMKNEGEPWLVDFFYFVSYKLCDSDLGPKLINAGFSIITVFFLLFRSKLPLIPLILIVFSYNLIFEYTIMTRPYSFAFMLVVIYYINYERYSKLLNVALLILIANAHNLFFILAPFLFLVQYNSVTALFKRSELKYLCLFAVGMLVTLYFSVPKSSEYVPVFDLSLSSRLSHSLSGFTVGLFPLPNFSVSDWNSSILYDAMLRRYVALISIVLLGVVFLQCKTFKTKVLFLSILPVFAFYFIFPINAMRYVTIYYTILVLIVLQLMYEGISYNTSFRYLLYLSLAISSFSGLYFCVKDIFHPFSQSKNTAAYLKNTVHEKDLVYVFPRTVYTTMNHYYHRDYLNATNDELINIACYVCYQRKASNEEIVSHILSKLQTDKPPMLHFITNRDLDSLVTQRTDSTIVYHKQVFTGAICKLENYRVYSFSLKH